MKTETTTQQLEIKETRYVCEEEECGFTTADKRQAEEHPWRKHKTFKKVRIDLDPYGDLRTESTLVLLETQEEFEQYQKIQEYVRRFKAEPWAGPGWYETWTKQVPCGHGCCTDTALFLRPASETVAALEKARQEIDDALETLGHMEVQHVVG